MKRLRTFQAPPSDDAALVRKVLVLVKAHTPSEWILEALSGKELYLNRENLKSDGGRLIKELVSLDPYIKKSTLEEALMLLDKEHNNNLSKKSKHNSSQGYWAKLEGYALKEQLLKNLKKAHNTNRYSRPRNMDSVVEALLSQRRVDSQEQDSPSATPGWQEKHRRLLRRRSSENDLEVVAVAGPLAAKKAREEILQKYGVSATDQVPLQDTLEEAAIGTGSPHAEPEAFEAAPVVDLTWSPSPPSKQPAKESPKGRSKMYFDMHRNKVVRAWTDGSLEEATTKEGPEGFVIGVFQDGQIFETEVPNISWGLPSRQALKEEEDKKKQEERERKKEEKQLQKAKAKAKPKAKMQATEEEPQSDTGVKKDEAEEQAAEPGPENRVAQDRATLHAHTHTHLPTHCVVAWFEWMCVLTEAPFRTQTSSRICASSRPRTGPTSKAGGACQRENIWWWRLVRR